MHRCRRCPASTPMNPATALARALLAELVHQGVRDVVLAPGSRSAPLAFEALRLDRAGRIRLHVRIDERSAGFLALGLAKVSGDPGRCHLHLGHRRGQPRARGRGGLVQCDPPGRPQRGPTDRVPGRRGAPDDRPGGLLRPHRAVLRRPGGRPSDRSRGSGLGPACSPRLGRDGRRGGGRVARCRVRRPRPGRDGPRRTGPPQRRVPAPAGPRAGRRRSRRHAGRRRPGLLPSPTPPATAHGLRRPGCPGGPR